MADTESVVLPRAPEAAHPAPRRVPLAGEVLATLRHRAVPLLVLAGIWLRAVQYLGNRSLWLDEALMLPTTAYRPLSEILSPAAVGPIPVGFQLLTRLLVLALGDGELVLRLVPFLAGVASLFLFLMVARRVLAERAVPVAMALFAFSPYLVYYASELKPYELDVVVTLALLLGALEIRRRGLSWGGAAATAVAAPIGVFFSLPAVFVMGGATLALIASAARRRDAALLKPLLAVVAVWGVVIGVPALLFLLSRGTSLTQANPYMQAFWSEGFMPFPPRTLQELAWFPQTLKAVFRDPMGTMTPGQSSAGFYQAAAGMTLCLVGIASLVAGRRFVGALTALPLALALLASALRVYPMGGGWVTGGRVLLYLAPILFLWMAHGVDRLRATPDAGVRFAAAVVLALALVPSVIQSVLVFPAGRNEVRPLLEYTREHWAPGDLLFVHYDAKHAFGYYAPRLGFTPAQFRIGACSRFQPAGYLDQMDALHGRRVWVLFTSGTGAFDFDERGLITDYLTRTGRRLDSRVARGASLHLYDLRAPRMAGARDGMRLQKLPPRLDQGCALYQ